MALLFILNGQANLAKSITSKILNFFHGKVILL